MPETSVVIPTYERTASLRRAIESVLAQTYTDFEVIVVDDGSSANIEPVVTSFGDDRLRFVGFEENRGANAARNAGIDAADGRYVSFLDSDDEFHAAYLERVIDALEAASPTVGGAFTSFELVSSDGMTDISHAPEGRVTMETVLEHNVVGGFSCLTVRADVFPDVGTLDEGMQSSQDHEFLIRLLEEYTLVGIPDVLVTNHVDSAGRISDDVERKITGHEQILAKHADKFDPASRSNMYYARGFVHARNDDLAAARQSFCCAIRTDPTNWLAYYHLASTLFGARSFRAALAFKSKLKQLVHNRP